MSEVTEQNEKLCVQLLLMIPLIILVVSSVQILNYSAWLLLPFQVYTLLIMIGVAGIILFMISRVTVPSSESSKGASQYFDDLETQERVFVIPTICPKCHTPVKLDRVWWEDEITPLCQECQSKIKLRIVKK